MEIHQIMTTNHNNTTPGLFQKGGPGGPGRPRGGRRENREYIDAIRAGFPPDEVTRLLNEALDLAVQTNSWRGVIAVLEFAASYSLGKPKQTVETAATGASLAELLADVDMTTPLLGDGDDGV